MEIIYNDAYLKEFSYENFSRLPLDRNIDLSDLMNTNLIKWSFFLTIDNEKLENTGWEYDTFYETYFANIEIFISVKYIFYTWMEIESQCLNFIKQNIIPKIYEKYFN